MKPWQKYSLVGLAGLLIWGYWQSGRLQNPVDTASTLWIDLTQFLGNVTGINMKTSQAGQDDIVTREGTTTIVYADVAGYLTVGVGHKIVPADGIFAEGDIVQQSLVDSWFAADLTHAENIVNHYTAGLNQNQFDALVSATFNLGSALFKNSDGSDTRVLTALDAGNYTAAATGLLAFNHSGGVVVAGLTTRRQEEQQQFLA